MAGAGEALEKSGLKLQDRFAQEDLLRMKNEADKELQTALATMREEGADRRLGVTEAGLGSRQAASIASTEGIHAADRTSRETVAREGHTVQREGQEIDRARVDEQRRHNQATEKLQAAAEGRLGKSAELDGAIKQLALDNAKRVEGLKKEFATATPERKKAITEEVQLLTGKDNDQYLPVPLKDEMGNVTGYKVFDKKRGVWVDNAGGGAPTGAKWDNTTGDVLLDGKKIGTAKTEAEARQILANAKKPAAPVAKEKPKGAASKGLAGVLDEQRPYKRPEQEEYVPQSPEG